MKIDWLKSPQWIPSMFTCTSSMGVRVGAGVGTGVGAAVVGTGVGAFENACVGAGTGVSVGICDSAGLGFVAVGAGVSEEGAGDDVVVGGADGAMVGDDIGVLVVDSGDGSVGTGVASGVGTGVATEVGTGTWAEAPQTSQAVLSGRWLACLSPAYWLYSYVIRESYAQSASGRLMVTSSRDVLLLVIA